MAQVAITNRGDTDNCKLNDSDYKFELHSLGILCFLESSINSGRRRVRRVVDAIIGTIGVEGFFLQIYRKGKKP